VLLQLMPVAFIFRIRANHEYPILVCLLLSLLGLAWIGEKRPGGWARSPLPPAWRGAC
jgi:4-amino-4-deoxy-L-arabinose transferase-like glycosyltransferase